MLRGYWDVIGFLQLRKKKKEKKKEIAHTHTDIAMHPQILRGKIIHHTTESEVLQGCYESHSINHIKKL